MLASGGDDTSIVIWDLQGRLERKGALPTDLELDAFWSDLKSEDALRAEQAIQGLVAGQERTAALIGRHLGPVHVASDQLITRLVYRLNSEHFEERAQAIAELTALDESAVPGLRRALPGSLSLECRRRIESLIDTQIEARWSPAGDRLRFIRALEVLEQIHNPRAHEFFIALSKGMSESWLTEEARAVLDRWAYHSTTAAH